MQVWDSVKVKNKAPLIQLTGDPAADAVAQAANDRPEHERAGEAGTVFRTKKSQPSIVVVEFDSDGVCEAVEVADLERL